MEGWREGGREGWIDGWLVGWMDGSCGVGLDIGSPPLLRLELVALRCENTFVGCGLGFRMQVNKTIPTLLQSTLSVCHMAPSRCSHSSHQVDERAHMKPSSDFCGQGSPGHFRRDCINPATTQG